MRVVLSMLVLGVGAGECPDWQVTPEVGGAQAQAKAKAAHMAASGSPPRCFVSPFPAYTSGAT